MKRAPIDPEPCFICHRRACGFGIAKNRAIRWVCQDCLPLAQKANDMSQRQFHQCEHDAIDDAMIALGTFLDEVGTTDLAELDVHNFKLAGNRMIRAFGDSMRKRITDDQAPF